jgi:hypothetical protein
MQYIVAGSNRTISFYYRNAQGEYFGSVARRRDRSWTPGELDLVMFDQQHPARAFTASSLMFHRIRFLPDAK